jgi:predicted enzyme related to lactoylglutathione lyase
MDNLIVWADIPVADLDRAMKFYAAVLQRPFVTMPGMEGIALPAPDQPPGAGGDGGRASGPMPVAFDLVRTDRLRPGTDGPTVYLNADDGPEAMMRRAVEAGGEVINPVQDMGEMVGWIGHFKDSEGNMIGVHKAHA